MKVAIVGGGVMGCASALALASRGARVVLLERAVPGAEASSAAAGMLGAQAEGHEPGDAFALFLRGRAAYEAWSRELEERSGGIAIGYRKSGILHLGWTDDDRASLAHLVEWQTAAGARAELLTGADARKIEPSISENVQSAAWFADDAQVEPPRLLAALAAAAARAGVEIRTGASVERLIVENDRCIGVRLDGEDLHADATVIAAGSWSSLVPGMPSDVPKVKPARGQMILLEERPAVSKTIVLSGGSYAVPRGDGRVVCGSTMEMVGYRREVTADGVRGILDRVVTAIPSLGRASFTSTWCNFRPYIDGGAPQMGKSTLPGLLLATGHFRNGILLAKVTADAVADAAFAG